MKYFRFIMGILLLLLPFLLPFWLTFGRILLGSGGWITVMYILSIGPFLFITLLLSVILLWTRKDVKEGKGIGTLDAFLVLGIFLSITLHGFFIVDAGDTRESINSLSMNVFGAGFMETAQLLMGVTFVSSFILLLAGLIIFIYERVKQRPLLLVRPRKT